MTDLRNIKKFFRSSENGQSLVEFALVLPIFLLLLFGLFQFAFIFAGQHMATTAAKEGVRMAAVGADDSEIKGRIMQMTAPLPFLEINPNEIQIDPERSVRFEDTVVTIEYPATINILLPFLQNVFKDFVSLTAQASMRVEGGSSFTPEPDSIVVDYFELKKQGNSLDLVLGVSDSNTDEPVSVMFAISVNKVNASGNDEVKATLNGSTDPDDGSYSYSWNNWPQACCGTGNISGTFQAVVYFPSTGQEVESNSVVW